MPLSVCDVRKPVDLWRDSSVKDLCRTILCRTKLWDKGSSKDDTNAESKRKSMKKFLFFIELWRNREIDCKFEALQEKFIGYKKMFMGVIKRMRAFFRGSRHDFVPILARQTDFLCKTSSLLVEMFGTDDVELRSRMEKEIKSCEVQGDALLTEFHEMLSGRPFVQVNKLDLQAVAMAMDDCLDVIKDTSKAVLIYRPVKLDDQLRELAQMAKSQSEVLHDTIPLLVDLKKNIPAISMACERVTELEHAADDAYEEYMGYIFSNEENTRELIKYKNLAEMLENATDAHKRISDNIRKLLLNYLAD